MTRWASDDLAGRAIEHFGDAAKVITMQALQPDGSMLCDEILSRRSYEEKVRAMGADIASANGGAAGGITLNVSALDAESFGNWLESKGGRVLRQFTVNQDREFIGTAGVW